MAYVILPKKEAFKGVHGELQKALAEKGFYLAGSSYADRYAKQGDPSSQSLFVYNRGINEDGSTNGKSNYNVLVLASGKTIRAIFTNPNESREAADFDYAKYTQTYTFSGGSTAKYVAKVIEAVSVFSQAKPENSYRVGDHGHVSELGGEVFNNGSAMKDDGRSTDVALLFNLILNNYDYFALPSSHNHFEYGPWTTFASEAAKYGLSAIPAFEATMPLFEHEPWLAATVHGKSRNPNGPHILLLFKAPEIASEFWQRNFSDRADYTYAPSASGGVELLKIYDLIDKEYPGQIARLVAHPACETSLPSVGIANRVAKGEITVQEMLEIIKRSNGIGLFNMTLDSTPIDFAAYHKDVDNCEHFSQDEKERRHRNMQEAEAYFAELLPRQGVGSKLFLNNINIALAKECASKFGTLPYVDNDSHEFSQGYTQVGPFFWLNKEMGLLTHGHNTLWLPSVPATKPTASDIVSFMIDRNALSGAEWKTRIFSTMKDGMVQITGARQDSSFLLKAWDMFESIFYYKRQGEVLLNDTAKIVKNQGTLHAIAEMGRDSIPA